MQYSSYYTQANNAYFLPRQRIPDSQKDDQWKMENVAAIAGLGRGNNQGSWRSTRQEKQVNYNLFNGEVDQDNFQYVTDPMGIGNKYGGHPARLEMHNIVKSKIELLKGEEGARPFNWMVRGTSGQVETIKTQKQRELLYQFMQQQFLQQMGLNPNSQEDVAKTPAQIQKYMQTEFMDSREITANQILNFVVKRDHVARKFNEGWEHALITAEELYYVGIKNGHPSVRVVNPIDFEYDKDSTERFIQYAEWAREERLLHPSSILDLYQEELTDDEIELIESFTLQNTSANMAVGYAFQEGVSPEYRNGWNSAQNTILVTNVAWRSWKQVWFLSAFDPETRQVLTTIVPAGYKLTKEDKANKATLDFKYDVEIWIGTMIGSDIFVDIRPADVQNGELPYCGYIYNSTNTKATSLMDLMKPHQYTYLIVWWRLMTELAKSKGNKMIMDMAVLPKSKGIDISRWIYDFDRLDIAWINSLEENGPQKKIALDNLVQKVDLSMSANVAQYIQIIEKIESQIAQLVGVSPQREAQTMASESATGNNIAMTQSSYITEPLFRYHNEVKKQVLTKILEVAKVAYRDGVKIQYVVDESYATNIQVNGDELNDSDYGIFVSDSSKDYQVKQKLERLADIALQQDKATLRDMVKLYNANSTAEFEAYLVQAEDRKVQQEQEMQKAQMASQEKIAADNIAWEREKEANADTRNIRDNNTKLEIADKQIQGQDKDHDGVPDSLEQGKVVATQMKTILDNQTKAKDLKIKEDKNVADTALKADDNRIKEKKVDLDHEDNQKDRAHEKQMAIKEEQMMEKEDRMKDKDFNRTIKLDNHKLQHEAKMGETKLKVAEKGLKVKEKETQIKMKANADKVKTAKAMPKIKAKPKTSK